VASVGVAYGAHAGDDFERFSPLFVAHSPRELHEWLLRHA
jgi:phosphoglycolate phosphatase